MNFSYDDRFFVSGAHFTRLAEMLRSGELRARSFEPGEPQRLVDVSPAGGRYDWETDTLVLGDGPDVMLVHEATHALQDHWLLDDDALVVEALAYVTEWVYLIYDYADDAHGREHAADYYAEALSKRTDNASRLHLAAVECIRQTGLVYSSHHVALTRAHVQAVADRAGYLGAYIYHRGRSMAFDGIVGCPR